ncbi:casein kinase II beta subunit [Rhizopus microsporus ATCC 52813]|uniref:Casein kinase II subunit beta n=2 Tax=Rhizopus microsporus TaxID=58291 RepID=A0A2G4SY80_RHIZD|nr:casein kinase II beta subunit [Rhizopus microsporus ATCC 52813]PHZ13722.1 casein kinase II beta subunit [Rhizopus microsporus ATCC 52813]
MNVYVDGDDSASMDLDQPQSWISWFCSAPNHKYYAEIDEKFIEDPFNLSGLSSQVPLYKETLEVILNMEPNDAMYSRIPDLSLLQPSAELLYGLIHQRYIITKDGMLQMLEKYKAGEFGKCPRVYCDGCHLLPCGQHDTPKQSNVRLYCPNCKDIYIPPNPKYAHIDGAHFGTTFPHLFFHTFPACIREVTPTVYQPKIFGFRVSPLSSTGPRMQWLRTFPDKKLTEEDEE